MHLIIFSSILTPRIKYIFNFIFKDILKTEVEFTGNAKYFLQSDLIKVSYGDEPLGDELFFKSTSLLFSNKLEDFKVKTTPFGDYQVPFPVQDSLFPFDIFAASFFIVSRYEEYLHKNKSDDDFKAEKSYQYKWKILDRPIIDEWALLIKNMIRKKHPQYKFINKNFSNQPCINLAISPSVPNGFINKAKFLFNSVFDKDNGYLSSKFDQVTGVSISNETVLTALAPTLEKKKLNPVFFIKFPNVADDYIQADGITHVLNDKSVGLLRPCINNKEKIAEVKAGISKLKKILPQQISLISQQLEVLKFPICYLNLVNSGVTTDYSMGYADVSGFRAGTCTPFKWYDLQLEKVTPLIVKSYCLNDSVLEFMGIDKIKTTIRYYIDTIKLINGDFISNWQLRSLSDHLKYKNLKAAFDEMHQYASY